MCSSNPGQIFENQSMIEITNVSLGLDHQVEYSVIVPNGSRLEVVQLGQNEPPWLKDSNVILAAFAMVVLSLIALIWMTKGLATSEKKV